MLIVDNLTTVADGLDDENEATAFRSVQKFLLRMKQAGIATILVHHAKKDGQDLRGSSSIATTFEVILGLIKPKVSSPGQASFVARFGKYRAKGDSSLEPYRWTLGETGWCIEDNPDDDSLEKTLKAFQSLDYASQDEIAKALGIAKSTVSKHVAKIIASRKATKDGLRGYLKEAKKFREGGDQDIHLDPEEEDEELPF